MARRLWTREELILTLSLYLQLLFGRLNKCTPEVEIIAELIGRTNNSTVLRLVNFAACVPCPIERKPNRGFLAYHRDRIFKGN